MIPLSSTDEVPPEHRYTVWRLGVIVAGAMLGVVDLVVWC